MPLKELCSGCEKAGLGNVSSVLATGNLVFSSTKPESDIRQTLDNLVGSYGLTNTVFLRRPEHWTAVIRDNPLAAAAVERPNHLLVLFLNEPVDAGLAADLGNYDGPEHLGFAGREVYIDYCEGVGRSRLTPAFLERKLGQPGTARNWNTIAKLQQISSAL